MDRTGRSSSVRVMASLVVILAGLIVLVGPAASARAAAINPVFGYQPKGTVTSSMAVILRGTVRLAGYPLDPANAKMYVDGVSIPRSSFQATASRNRPYFYYAPKPVIADGAHTFRVEMPDTSGRVYAFQWNATVAVPPTGSWLRPAANYVGYTGYPAIEMSLSDNTPGTEFTVNGAVRAGSATGEVVATFAGSGLSAGKNSFSLAAELAPGTYYLTATVADGGGFVRSISGTAARKFTLIAAPPMTRAPEDCLASACHVRTGHPATGMTCAKCHVKVYHYSASCDGCHDPHKGPITVTGKTGPCTTCHGLAYPAVKQHTSATTEAAHAVGCGGCHADSFMGRHAVTPDGSAYPNQCDVCHASEETPVQAALDAGDSTCSACHDPLDWHAGVDHSGTDAGARFMGWSSFPGCTDTAGTNRGCHDLSQVNVLHARRSDKGCALCHSHEFDPPRDCVSCHLSDPDGTTRWDFTLLYIRPSGDGTSTAGISVFPAVPGTHWDKVDDSITLPDYDTTYISYDALDGEFTRALYTFDPPVLPRQFAPPAEVDWKPHVAIRYRVRRVGTSTLPKIGASVNVGGSYYNLTTPAPTTPPESYPTNTWAWDFVLTTNPKTGQAWRTEDLTDLDSENALREFGLYTTDVTNPIRVTQCYLLVTLRPTVSTSAPTQGKRLYHHNNVKYLMDPSDVNALPRDQRWAVDPPGGWMDLLVSQDCGDKCHTNWSPAPVYSPYEGKYMWHSLAGANGDPLIGPTTRTLTLAPFTVPDESPSLEFMTNWRLNEPERTTSTGYVEISTDGGDSFSPLTGLVDGVEMASYTENASGWVPAVYDLTAYAGQDVKLRFRFVAGTDNEAGWAFDKLVISGTSGVVFSDGAETLRPEWTNSTWNRSLGAFPFVPLGFSMVR